MPEERFVKGTNYHTLEGLYEEARDALAGSRLPHDWVEIGRSAGDNPIYAACIGDGDFRKPEVLYLSGLHPMEYIGPRMSLELLRHLAAQCDEDETAAMLNDVNAWFILTLNPDGYLGVQRSLSTPPGIVYKRKNARGVDLNRNFPVAFYKHSLSMSPFAGSIIPSSPYYHGPEPCSEPETRALRDFVLGRNIKISIDIHSFGNFIAYPYSYTVRKCRDEEAFIRIGREMLKRQRFKYRLFQSSKHYIMGGDVNDWLYDEFRTLAFLIELGPLGVDLNDFKTVVNPFYWANPVEPSGVTSNSLHALEYLIRALHEMFARE